MKDLVSWQLGLVLKASSKYQFDFFLAISAADVSESE